MKNLISIVHFKEHANQGQPLSLWQSMHRSSKQQLIHLIRLSTVVVIVLARFAHKTMGLYVW